MTIDLYTLLSGELSGGSWTLMSGPGTYTGPGSNYGVDSNICGNGGGSCLGCGPTAIFDYTCIPPGVYSFSYCITAGSCSSTSPTTLTVDLSIDLDPITGENACTFCNVIQPVTVTVGIKSLCAPNSYITPLPSGVTYNIYAVPSNTLVSSGTLTPPNNPQTITFTPLPGITQYRLEVDMPSSALCGAWTELFTILLPDSICAGNDNSVNECICTLDETFDLQSLLSGLIQFGGGGGIWSIVSIPAMGGTLAGNVFTFNGPPYVYGDYHFQFCIINGNGECEECSQHHIILAEPVPGDCSASIGPNFTFNSVNNINSINPRASVSYVYDNCGAESYGSVLQTNTRTHLWSGGTVSYPEVGGGYSYVRVYSFSPGTYYDVPTHPSSGAVITGCAGTAVTADLTYDGLNGFDMAVALQIVIQNYLNVIGHGCNGVYGEDNTTTGKYIIQVTYDGFEEEGFSFYSLCKHQPSSTWLGILKSDVHVVKTTGGNAIVTNIGTYFENFIVPCLTWETIIGFCGIDPVTLTAYKNVLTGSHISLSNTNYAFISFTPGFFAVDGTTGSDPTIDCSCCS